MGQYPTILIVDDEELIRLNLRALLEDLGYRVAEAVDGLDGLDAFDRERPDLVMADLRMPVMDGLSMIAALRDKSPETPVIVVSGAGTVREAVDSLRVGAWDYIMKPVPDAEGLDITIRRALEKARLLRENRLYRENLEKTAEALRVSEERYALAVEGANDVIWDVDLATGKMYHSERITSILGYEEHEIPSMIHAQEWRDWTHPADYQRVLETRDSYLKGRRPSFEIEFRLRHKDGDYRWVACRGACVRDSQGRAYRMAGSLTDITERKKLEQQILQSRKMESVVILAGGVAHEFNNLLTAISGYGQMLQERISSDDELSREGIGSMLKAAKRAAELTTSLLAFSRKQITNPEPVPLDAVISRAGQRIQEILGDDIEFRMTTSDADLLVKADIGQMEQVLTNLASNAHDAMPHGGRLLITTGKEVVREGAEALHDLAAPGAYAVISVSDTGIGIDKDLEKIFEPFYSTKKLGEGTGLGLSIAYGIIKQHNGSIMVGSEPGRGTTFTIYLPLIAGHAREEKPETPSPHVTDLKTVLVAEDEAIVRCFLKRMLEKEGYKVILAEDGEEAVARFREHDGISLVLSDVVMPGKDGKQVLDEIRKLKPGIKVVFISGYAADVIKDKGMLDEGTDLIRKPFDKNDLL
ncbi:MAG TPA: response regulator, partial [Geobacteraceae bacterium]|nr:response regulator [Geobacteraceae bacterium]